MATDELLAEMLSSGAVELGEFVLKSGQISPIYVDLRLFSDLENSEKTVTALCQAIRKEQIQQQFDLVVGVPYGAIPLAVLTGKDLRKNWLQTRKEPKAHGKKLMVEGKFRAGQTVLVVEDVVTSGASVLETVQQLRQVALLCAHVFCVVDREQGGTERLAKEGIQLHSLIRLHSILDYLVSAGRIDQQRREALAQQLREPVYRQPAELGAAPGWALQTRLPLFPEGSLNRRLAQTMLAKKTNLCLAVDNCSPQRILEIVDCAKEHICALKLHYSHLFPEDKDEALLSQLRKAADEHRFLLFEDRKFGDTAETTKLDLTKGRVAQWADVVTVHTVPGAKSIEALAPVLTSSENRLSSLLLVAEMSTEGANARVPEAVQIAESMGPSLVGGFVCQKRCHSEPKFLYWTPGVNLAKSSDGQGQCWRGPEQAVQRDGCDLIIVGRGITEADDVGAEAQRYAKAGWEALAKRQ